jgi:ABC-type amino acid transport substrate-binding protein
LQTGPVLVVPLGSPINSLEEMDHQVLLVSKGSWILDYMGSYPEVELQFYSYVTDALEDLVKQKAMGTLMPIIPAASYVGDLYFNELEIVGEPLLDEGIRLATLQGGSHHLLALFDDALKEMKKDGTLEKLVQKWSLPEESLMR